MSVLMIWVVARSYSAEGHGYDETGCTPDCMFSPLKS